MKNKNYEGLLVDRNLEIFELEEKIKKLSVYRVMYFKKQKDLERIKQELKRIKEKATDEIQYEIQKLLDGIEGVKYHE